MPPTKSKSAQKTPVPGVDCLNVSDALRGSLGSVGLTAADGAAVRLALSLAAEIDGGGDLEKLSGRLLAVLSALGMTPAARAAAAKGGASDGESGPSDALARLRAARANRT